MKIYLKDLMILLISILVLAACDVREIVDKSDESNYRFDGSVSFERIRPIPVTNPSWSLKYSPRLDSTSFYALAQKVLPSPDWSQAMLVSVATRSISCKQTTTLGRMNFEWNLPSASGTQNRQRLYIIVDAQVGLINSLQEFRSGDIPTFDPRARIDPSQIENVMPAIRDWLIKNPQPELVSQSDCTINASTYNLHPDHWIVWIGSQKLKKSKVLFVDHKTFNVARQN